MFSFQANDLSIESQWRAIILFGKNSATYKFGFAKALLELVDKEKTNISLGDLAVPFAKSIIDHVTTNDKQGNSNSSKFLDVCRKYIKGEINDSILFSSTEKLGFVNVIDAFQNVNGSVVPNKFYEKNFANGKKEIVITDELLKLKEKYQFQNLDQEVDARWKLVETAWNLQINPSLLEVKYDENKSLFFIENDFMKRVDITSVRDSLNGYQKGKCFYSFQDISINKSSSNICEVDHFLPHSNKLIHSKHGANINGVWNLVLADGDINLEKRARIPDLKYLDRLYARNEFYIESKHPLAETIINQTGLLKQHRRAFLQKHYDLSRSLSIQTWKPSIELKATF